MKCYVALLLLLAANTSLVTTQQNQNIQHVPKETYKNLKGLMRCTLEETMAPRIRSLAPLLLLITSVFARPQDQTQRLLIIDVHLHALKLSGFGTGGGPLPKICSNNEQLEWKGWDPREPFTIEGSGKTCPDGFAPARSDEELMQRTLAMLKRYNIRAVTSGPIDQVTRWHAAAPDRIIPATPFKVWSESHGQPAPELRRLVAEGKVAVFAEVGPQYAGMSPADPALEPYFALAEELDIPVGIHMGEGPPGGRNVEGYSAYRVRMGNPLLLEDVLVRHPKLRIYVMHYGSPFVDDMIALLYSYPQVYADIADNDWSFPRKHFHHQLRRLPDEQTRSGIRLWEQSSRRTHIHSRWGDALLRNIWHRRATAGRPR
jgi:hypothetical protein